MAESSEIENNGSQVFSLFKFSSCTKKGERKHLDRGVLSIAFDRPFLDACILAVKGVSHCGALIPKIGTCMQPERHGR